MRNLLTGEEEWESVLVEAEKRHITPIVLCSSRSISAGGGGECVVGGASVEQDRGPYLYTGRFTIIA